MTVSSKLGRKCASHHALIVHCLTFIFGASMLFQLVWKIRQNPQVYECRILAVVFWNTVLQVDLYVMCSSKKYIEFVLGYHSKSQIGLIVFRSDVRHRSRSIRRAEMDIYILSLYI